MKMEQKVKERTFKQMLWISMISMTMMFAGLTSAYVVSRAREDWVSFELPSAFYLSTILIVLSSLTFFMLVVSVIPAFRITGSLYLLPASAIIIFALGLVMLYYGIKLHKEQTDKMARKLMLSSVLYITLIQIIFVIDKFFH